MGKIFDYDNKFFQALEGIANIVILNFLFIICCIPIVTIGASMTATYSVAMSIVDDREPYIFREFFKKFKENFKQSTIVWIILFLVVVFISVDFYICSLLSNNMICTVLKFVLTLVSIVLGFVIIYVFPLISKFENSVKNTLVNAILISVQNLPYTIVMLIISLLPIGSLLLFPNYWGQIIFFNTAISYGMVAYLNSIFLNKILNKYIN